jgi:putative transposase
MGNPLRNRNPGIFRIITIRTEGAHFWMRPSKDINKIIGGVIARYAEILGVEIYAYVFVSNHYHLLIRCPLGNSDEFEENVNRELARRLNWKNRRTGKFWARRYSEQEVLSDNDLVEAFLYIVTNATRHGLVANPKDWPGLCSYNQCLNEKELIFPFHHYSAEDDEVKVTYHALKLSMLPEFEGLSKKERQDRIQKLLDEKVKELVEDRKSQGLGFLGVEAIKAQSPNNVPQNISKSPRPPCYTKCNQLRKEFKRREADRRDAYDEASMRFRLGNLNTIFPDDTHKPPLHRKPRLLPFQPLPDDYFKNAA